jgi:uncharacterized protein YecE (DUF72 family)
MAILRVGCALWAHPGWRGRFVPSDLRREEQLPAYASWCTAVEGNTTAYGLPSPATVAGWAAATPPSFRFLFKLPQDITHHRRLRGTEADVAAAVDLLAPLGERAERLWVQLPAAFGPTDVGALATLLSRAPAGPRWVVEVRHPAFFERGPAARGLARVLRQHDAEWATFDTTTLFATPPTTDAERDGWSRKPRLPRRVVALGEHPVVRYIGRDDHEATVAGWQPWVPVVAGWLEEGRSPTVFVHTPDNDAALGLARRFHDEVRAAATIPVDPLPEPMTVSPTTLF